MLAWELFVDVISISAHMCTAAGETGLWKDNQMWQICDSSALVSLLCLYRERKGNEKKTTVTSTIHKGHLSSSHLTMTPEIRKPWDTATEQMQVQAEGHPYL